MFTRRESRMDGTQPVMDRDDDVAAGVSTMVYTPFSTISSAKPRLLEGVEEESVLSDLEYVISESVASGFCVRLP